MSGLHVDRQKVLGKHIAIGEVNLEMQMQRLPSLMTMPTKCSLENILKQ